MNGSTALRSFVLRFTMNFRLALGALGARPGRTALTLLGIVIGIVALVVMMSLTTALRTTVLDATQPLGSGVFQVQREPRLVRKHSRKAKLAEQRKAFTVADVRALEGRLSRVESVAGEMWAWGQRVSTKERQTNPLCGVAGAMPAFLDANGMELEAGRFLTEQDLSFERPVAVIGADIVLRLFPGGAAEAIGSTIRIQQRTFEVIGTLRSRPALFGAAWRNSIAVLPITTFHQAFGFRSLHVTFKARDAEDLERAQNEAVVAIRWMRGVQPGEPNDFEIFSNESVSGELDKLAVMIGAATAGVCLLALLVGGIGVMNIMLVSVTERTREIGIRKALGARPSTILGQFIVEAVVLAVLGGAVGVLVAAAMVLGAAALLHLPPTLPLWSIAIALVSSSAIGLVAGIYPAARAARLDPIEALRYE